MAPTAWAASASWRSGVIVPSAFDMPVTLRIFVRSVSSEPSAERSSRPSSVSGMYRSVAPVTAAVICHGTMLEWCSISVISTSSPSRRCARPHPCATRFIDSVTPRVNTIVSGSGAPRNRATVARAPS